MRFEVGRLIGHHGIRGRVRFVKAVPRELLYQIKQFLGLLIGDEPRFCPFEKFGPELVHFLRFFLAHRSPENIRLAQGKARHAIGNRHHLFLIDNDTVCLGQQLFKGRHFVRDGDFPLLTFDKVRNKIHRAGSVEGDDGNNLFEPIWAKTGEEIAHAGTFQLEDPGGLAAGQQREGLRIVERNGTDRKRIGRPAARVDQALGVRDHGQGLKAKEIKFH